MTDLQSYTKSTQDYFPDYCDQRTYGVSAVSGDEFVTLVPNIVSNPMKWANSLSGFKNPGWREAVRRGDSATTVMTANEISVNNPRKCFTDIRTRQLSGFPGNWSSTEWKGYPLYAIPNTSTVPPALLSEVRNIALAKFLKHANDARSGSQFGETLGEWKETVRAVTNPLESLRRFVVGHVKRAKKRIKRDFPNSHGGRRRGGKKKSRSETIALTEAIAGTYLEFTFGWIPLVKSVNEAVITLLDRNDQPKTVVVSGRGGRLFDGSDTEITSFTKDNIKVYRNRKSYSEVSHRYRGCIQTGVVDGTRSVAQSLGLIPERWIPTIWELIPYSFVIDYFVNVGDIIAAMSFRRSSIQWGTSTTKIQSVYDYSDFLTRDVAPPGYWGVSKQLLRRDAWGGGAQIERTTVSRSDILTANLLPDVTFHMPYTNKAWVNMGAILTSKFCSVW